MDKKNKKAWLQLVAEYQQVSGGTADPPNTEHW